MRPRFFPTLVNGRFGDPAVYVDFLNERRAILFDIGDIHSLPARSVLRLSDIFVSHTHIDHFVGFDYLLRLVLGRGKRFRLYGPIGFIDRIEAKLNAYTWNLRGRFRDDLVFSVMELASNSHGYRAQFRLKSGFTREAHEIVHIHGGVIWQEPSLTVTFAELEHRTPCLAFAMQETQHINIWKNRLDALGLAVGPWLDTLKRAIHEGLPESTLIEARTTGSELRSLQLGELRDEIVSVSEGQKIVYVTDAAPTKTNAEKIVELADGADILFIEAVFAKDDIELARDRAHLTTERAGTLARRSGAVRVEPFHFSPRYTGDEDRLLAEIEEALGRGLANP